MIVRIARKETTEVLRDGRFRWSAGFVLALLLGSMLVGWRHHAQLQAQHAAAEEAERAVWVGQGEKNPHSAAHYGTWAFKPTTALSGVDRGVNAYTGVAVFLEGHVRHAPQFRPAEDATATARLGEMTAAATLQLLVPLLIVLLAFPAFAGEREAGTLRQLVSLGVPRRALAWGKALGIAAPLALLLVPAALVGGAALAFSADVATASWSLPRAAVLAGVYLLYFAVVLGVALVVSALAWSSRAALVVLLGLWFANAFVAPRVAVGAAAAAAPAPTPAEWAAALRAYRDARPPWEEQVQAITDRLVAEQGVASADELTVEPEGIALKEDEDNSTAFFRAQFAALAAAHERQASLAQLAGVTAPLLAVQSLSMALAGSDLRHHHHFLDATEAYRYDLVQTLNADLALNARSAADAYSYTVGREMWEETIAPFEYRPPTLAWALKGVRTSLIALGGWILAVVVALPLALARARID